MCISTSTSYDTSLEGSSCSASIFLVGYMKSASSFLFETLSKHPNLLPGYGYSLLYNMHYNMHYNMDYNMYLLYNMYYNMYLLYIMYYNMYLLYNMYYIYGYIL